MLDSNKRLKFKLDPELDAQFPQKRLARVTIQLKDGRELKSPVYAAPGEHTDCVDLEWITAKFNRVTAPVLSKDHQAELLNILTTQLDMPIRSVVEYINHTQS